VDGLGVQLKVAKVSGDVFGRLHVVGELIQERQLKRGQ